MVKVFTSRAKYNGRKPDNTKKLCFYEKVCFYEKQTKEQIDKLLKDNIILNKLIQHNKLNTESKNFHI